MPGRDARDNRDDFGFWISDWGFNFRKDQQSHPVFQMYRVAKIVEICTIMALA